jgi:SAM-dependent methyltransferase
LNTQQQLIIEKSTVQQPAIVGKSTFGSLQKLVKSPLVSYTMEDFWNERYAQAGYAYGTNPNHYFQMKLDAIRPAGNLLLPAEGEGRNAVYAGTKGWEVTAFDYSLVGQRKALELAREHGVIITYQVESAQDIALAPEQFDCLALVYAHFEKKTRAMVHSRLLDALKPGGTVIFEAYAREQAHYQQKYSSGGPKEAQMLFTLEDIQQEFAGIQIEELQKTEIIALEGKYHRGPSCVLQFKGTKL